MKYPVHIVAAGGFVLNDAGQVLLLKSPRYGDWEFPGGQIEEGETIPKGLEREVLEETGIVVKITSLIGIYSNIGNPPIVNMDFLCEYVSGEPRTSDESIEVKWVNLEDALNLVERKAIRTRLKNMLEFSGEVNYLAYVVNPSNKDLTYQEFENRKI
ncbi:MAG: NUDIX domain-containing protein [Anaerolineales bacterium]|nr:NUDIX domain-containing protein [Anaerolineales bacterium]